MLDKITNIKTVVILIILRVITGIISMPTIEGEGTSDIAMTTYTQIDSIFRLISTLLMILIIIIALNALGNYSKHKTTQE